MGLKVNLLRQSFAVVAPQAGTLTENFYVTLFVRYPQVVPLFEGVDLRAQRNMLASALAFVINNLEKPGALFEGLEAMGARHLGYGAQAEHYPAVGECLLAALGTVAGPAWTKEVADAWTEAYLAVSQIMLQGAAKAEQHATA